MVARLSLQDVFNTIVCFRLFYKFSNPEAAHIHNSKKITKYLQISTMKVVEEYRVFQKEIEIFSSTSDGVILNGFSCIDFGPLFGGR